MKQAPALPPIARLDHIDHRPAETPFLRVARDMAAETPVWREDLRFFLIAYLAALIVFLSWLA